MIAKSARSHTRKRAQRPSVASRKAIRGRDGEQVGDAPEAALVEADGVSTRYHSNEVGYLPRSGALSGAIARPEVRP